MKKVFIASDHAGVELKSKIIMDLSTGGFSSQFETFDLGPQSTDSVDYPDYADLLCKKLHGFTLIDLADDRNSHPTEFGILICGSGIGMSIRANKYLHIRAALCSSIETAQLAREHNDANVICLGARVTDHEICIKSVHRFLATSFAGGRHRSRVVKLSSPV